MRFSPHMAQALKRQPLWGGPAVLPPKLWLGRLQVTTGAHSTMRHRVAPQLRHQQTATTPPMSFRTARQNAHGVVLVRCMHSSASSGAPWPLRAHLQQLAQTANGRRSGPRGRGKCAIETVAAGAFALVHAVAFSSSRFGLPPAPRMLTNFCNRSNQNGAPRVRAVAVNIQPRTCVRVTA